MEKPIFILIRGNSGSGKTALADSLQERLGYHRCLVLHEDVLRRDILHVKEGSPLTAELIKLLVDFGKQKYAVVILEGILPRKIYGELLKKIITEFGSQAYSYYLDVSFAETLKHNQLKPEPFARETLQKWWLTDDYLAKAETRLGEGPTAVLADRILAEVNL
ncbi:zeta toxin family protein [Lactobacillus sp. ESL0731]|uniref:zeta toxin family protein n=1 Tax=unclassified Lactobacillus TaxID=2620435 RepID=UPI0023F81CF6|nr:MULTISPECIES: zeta toxin family protein [unclassified Lactobacillus]WEV51203.1 zeta toxin family protein [Lactobacillus sp. ESL0700]WEV62333.1 zeta toxin family protein [Lactobacillus sp. ESL0731]